MVSTATVFHTCDSCSHEVGGYTKKDLLEEGWKFHDVGGGRMFVMCGACEQLYAERRTARTAA